MTRLLAYFPVHILTLYTFYHKCSVYIFKRDNSLFSLYIPDLLHSAIMDDLFYA